MIESADEFVMLRNSEIVAEYNRAAHEPASEEVWLEVIDRYPDMKKWVIHNKTIPHSILRLLSDDPDPSVRWWVAMKRKAEPAILEKLAADLDESVRIRVACNQKTPDAVLERLARDSSAEVSEPAIRQIADRLRKATT